jgi:hypothetical protein
VNEGVNIPYRGQISPLGARGEVKNCPLFRETPFPEVLHDSFCLPKMSEMRLKIVAIIESGASPNFLDNLS